jgi:hypothetical protein
MERKIESNPWVQGAEVLKNWDSGIVTVEVKERRAVLSGLLNGREVYYSADGAELPGLGGARLGRVELDAGRVEEIWASSGRCGRAARSWSPWMGLARAVSR